MNKETCKIDIEKLIDIVQPNPVKNLYLSPYSDSRSFINGETLFLYNGFMIALYQKGEMSLKVNGNRYLLREGSILLLFPEQFVEVESRSNDLERVSIHAHPEVVMGISSPIGAELMKWGVERPVIDASKEELERLLEYYRFMEKRYEEKENVYRPETITALYYAFLLEISNLYRIHAQRGETVGKSAGEKISRDFFTLLIRHYKQERSVTFYAGQMHLSPRYLSKTIKRLTGHSTLEWLNKLIIVEIKKQLQTTEQAVWQIAEELNFSSPSAMVQFFKLHTGITPLAYRNRTP